MPQVNFYRKPFGWNIADSLIATPKDSGDLGPAFRCGALRAQRMKQWERNTKMDTPPIQRPHMPHCDTPWPSMNGSHGNAVAAGPPIRPIIGRRSGFLAFGTRNPRHNETSSLGADITHATAASTDFKTVEMGGTAVGRLGLGRPHLPPKQTPSFNPNITHPNIWRQGIPIRYPWPEAAPPGRWEYQNALRNMKGPTIRGEPDVCRQETPRAKRILISDDSDAREAFRQAHRDPSDIAEPGKVVTTVRRGAQHTISASDTFAEVRECVIEYLGSEVER